MAPSQPKLADVLQRRCGSGGGVIQSKRAPLTRLPICHHGTIVTLQDIVDNILNAGIEHVLLRRCCLEDLVKHKVALGHRSVPAEQMHRRVSVAWTCMETHETSERHDSVRQHAACSSDSWMPWICLRSVKHQLVLQLRHMGNAGNSARSFLIKGGPHAYDYLDAFCRLAWKTKLRAKQ